MTQIPLLIQSNGFINSLSKLKFQQKNQQSIHSKIPKITISNFKRRKSKKFPQTQRNNQIINRYRFMTITPPSNLQSNPTIHTQFKIDKSATVDKKINIIPINKNEIQKKFSRTSYNKFNILNDINQKNTRVSIMNLDIGTEEGEIIKRKQQIIQFQMMKYLIERRRYRKLKQKSNQNSKKNLNDRLQSQQYINNRLINEILSEIKKLKNLSQNQTEQLKTIALQQKVKQRKQIKKNPINIFLQEISAQKQKIKSQTLLFGFNDYNSDKIYKKKIFSYIEFLYKINFSNSIYRELKIKDYETDTFVKKYKVYIGKGNNSLLIKNLIHRRIWMQIVDNFEDQQQIDFYWTQLSLSQIHKKQKSHPKTQKLSLLNSKLNQLKSRKLLVNKLNQKIMNNQDNLIIQNIISIFGLKQSIYDIYIPGKITNHLPQNYHIGQKKKLFNLMFFYYKDILKKNPFQFIPETFQINNLQDQKYKLIIKNIQQTKGNKIWIIKPAQNSNRGNGICLARSNQILQKLSDKFKMDDNSQSYILQSYIHKPFLYNHRKFDIRHYLMITSVNGIIKAFWYQEGYIRTSSLIFDTDDINNVFIHLTNDAIQKNGQFYGKYQSGNKLSYAQFQRYIDLTYPHRRYNFQDILVKMKNITIDVINASFTKIDIRRKHTNFQIFGMDFMIDNNFKPWLIQINSNPCLQIACPLLQRLIPGLIQNAFRIGLDPLFSPPTHYPPMKRHLLSDNILQNLKFELIFDEKYEGDKIRNKYQQQINKKDIIILQD